MDLLRALVQKGKLSQGQVKEINARVVETGNRAEELIVSDGLIEEKELFQIKSELINVPRMF